MKIKIVASIVAISILGCISFTPKTTHRNSGNISLEMIEKLKIDKTTQEEARNIFGAPTGADYNEWSYYSQNTGYQQMVLSFDSTSLLLRSVLWIPEANNSGLTVENAKKNFPNSSFTLHNPSQISSHALPAQKNYVDEIHGISIVSANSSGDVEMIVWANSLARFPAQK